MQIVQPHAVRPAFFNHWWIGDERMEI